MRTSSKAAEKGKQKEQTAPKRLGDVKPGANHSKATRGFLEQEAKDLEISITRSTPPERD